MDERASIERVLDGRAWDEFCESLKGARGALFRETSPGNAFDRAEGYRHLSRLLRVALERFVEHADPTHPRFYQMARADAKLGADNPDCRYQNCALDGGREYRLRGRRGTSTYLGIGTYYGSYGDGGPSGCSGYMDSADLVCDADGRFEIRLSQKPQPGNWLPLTPDTSMVLIRETFLDRTRETAGKFTIERINGPKKPRPLTAERLEKGLLGAAAFVKGTAKTFADWAVELRQRPNEIWTADQTRFIRGGGDPNIFYLFGYWEIGADEALVIDTEVPECELWNIQIDNYWYESLEYRHLPVCLNSQTARYNKDGSLTMVLAHEDPGVPNYLDTGGHAAGTLLLRWTRAKTHPLPQCKLVKVASLKSKSAA